VGLPPAGINVRMKAEDIVGIRHHETTGEDTKKISVCCSELQNVRISDKSIVTVITMCKCSISPSTNPNPVYSHSYTCENTI
jgi:hypothetical protein